MSNKWNEYIREMDEGISKVAEKLSTISSKSYYWLVEDLSFLKGMTMGQGLLQEMLENINNNELLVKLYNYYRLL
jgi:hypothetical protein